MPVVECNPVSNFEIEEPVAKDETVIVLRWAAPEEGSTGTLERYELYRDSLLLATLEPDVYEYMDTIGREFSIEYYITAVYSDGCEAASESLTVTFTQVDETAQNITVYPNPVERQVTVKATGLQRVVVYNLLGQQMTSLETNHHECVIDTEGYPQGVYVIQVTTNNGNQINKTIVKL